MRPGPADTPAWGRRDWTGHARARVLMKGRHACDPGLLASALPLGCPVSRTSGTGLSKISVAPTTANSHGFRFATLTV